MADETITNPTETTPPAITETPAQTTPVETLKYSDKQVNDLIAAKQDKVLQKALKEAGLDSVDDLKALAELKKSAMSESERTAARMKELETKLNGDASRADRAEAKAEALSLGVPKERVDRMVKLALSENYEGDMAARIAKVAEEFPEFVKAPEGAAFGKEPKDQKVSELDTLMAQARKAAGLS